MKFLAERSVLEVPFAGDHQRQLFLIFLFFLSGADDETWPDFSAETLMACKNKKKQKILIRRH